MHRKENLAKCTVWPVRGRPELTISWWPPGSTNRNAPNAPEGRSSTDILDEPTAWVRLGLEGEPLCPDDADLGLLVLDATWRLVAPIEQAFASVPTRRLPSGLTTALPRRSKLYQDPSPGLATIEAMYVAYRLTGRPTAGLLEHYRWAEPFLAANRDHLGPE